ncbi:hypothetical protein VUR80DRAFT_5715 [Thermomyces stellatus]
MFNSLLREDTPVNIADDGGKFPLHHAVEKRDMQMIKDLIRFGADVDAADRNKQPALHLLAQPRTKGLLQPTRDIVDTLMAEGEDASAQDCETENFIETLLKYKPDINRQNNQGISPLERLVRETLQRNIMLLY